MREFKTGLFCLAIVLFLLVGCDPSSGPNQEGSRSDQTANNEATDGLPCILHPEVSINPEIKGGADAVDISDDGRFAIVQGYGDSKNVQIWDIEKKQKLHSYSNPTGGVLPVAMSPDGSLAAYAHETSISVCEVASGQEKYHLKSVSELASGYERIRDIFFSPKGDMLLASKGARVVEWNVSTGQQIVDWIAEKEEISALSNYFDQGKKVATSGEAERGLIKIWDVETGKTVQTLNAGPEEKVTSISVSPDGKKLASSTLWKGLPIWDVASGKVVHTISDVQMWSDIEIHPNGKWLFYCTSEGDIIVFDLFTYKKRCKLSRHSSAEKSRITIWSMAVTPNGETLISGGDDGTFKVWDLKSLE